MVVTRTSVASHVPGVLGTAVYTAAQLLRRYTAAPILSVSLGLSDRSRCISQTRAWKRSGQRRSEAASLMGGQCWGKGSDSLSSSRTFNRACYSESHGHLEVRFVTRCPLSNEISGPAQRRVHVCASGPGIKFRAERRLSTAVVRAQCGTCRRNLTLAQDRRH